MESEIICGFKIDFKRDYLKGKWESFDISWEIFLFGGLEEGFVIIGFD